MSKSTAIALGITARASELMNADYFTYSNEDFSQFGGEIFRRDVLPRLCPADDDKFVAIDIATGSYELDADDYLATERLLARHPGAQIWVARVGQPAAFRIASSADDAWFDYQLEHDPRFLDRIRAARAEVAAGRVVRLEDLPE